MMHPTPSVPITAFHPERVRADFPALHQEVNGHPLIYLDNAATTQKPRAVIEAVERFYTRDCSNIHRGVHTLAERATGSYEGARRTVAAFVGAPDPSEVVFTRGTTEAINLVARSHVLPRLSPGDEVLVSWMEHHANIVPWQIVCREAGATLRPIPIDDRGVMDLEALERALSERTRMVALSHISNALGTVNPIRRVVELARARGVPVLVDGAQAAPHRPIDVVDLGCDFYAFSGHKVFGPSGIGVLWGKAEHLADMPPLLGGGMMIRTVSFEGTTFADPPTRFEAGTPNIEGAAGLAAAIDYLSSLDRAALAEHEHALVEHACEELAAIRGLRLIGTAPEREAIVSFTLEGVHPHDVGTILDGRGVAIRAGHHCAQPVMKRFGVPATARASFALYNTHHEVEALVGAVRYAQEMFGA
ncbi:MAG: cysteine desulfurase [Acidobacteriota bacterium]|jgi:cysteine desulfurase/selenocysteine lyase